MSGHNTSMSHDSAARTGTDETAGPPPGAGIAAWLRGPDRSRPAPLVALSAISAEFAGTLLFVSVAAGSAVAAGPLGSADTGGPLLVVALGSGLPLGVVIAATFRLSGGHINPVVTLVALLVGKLSPARAVAYAVAQLLGGVAGTVLVDRIAGDGIGPLGTTVLATELGTWPGLLAEAAFTFVLVFVVFAAAMDPRPPRFLAPFAIGLTVLAINLVGASLTGASMNPARSLGPALVSGQWDGHWVYWAGPVLGGLLAAWVYKTFLWPSRSSAIRP